MQDDDAYAAPGTTVVERDGEMMRLQIETDKGSVVIVAECIQVERLPIINKADVGGESLTRTRIRELAKRCGRIKDMKEVIPFGGRRSPRRQKRAEIAVPVGM